MRLETWFLCEVARLVRRIGGSGVVRFALSKTVWLSKKDGAGFSLVSIIYEYHLFFRVISHVLKASSGVSR